MSETPQTPQDWTKYWQEQGQHQNRYAEPKPPGQVPYGFNDFQYRFAYAGWGSRVLASLLDTFLILCVELVVGGAVLFTGSLDAAFTAAGGTGLILWVVFGWLNGSPGQTPGKRVMNIRVVHHETGDRIGGLMGVVRSVVTWAISAFTCGIAGLIDVLWPLWDEKNRTLHDMVVGSVVIRDRAL